jgi:hypothetical protein
MCLLYSVLIYLLFPHVNGNDSLWKHLEFHHKLKQSCFNIQICFSQPKHKSQPLNCYQETVQCNQNNPLLHMTWANQNADIQNICFSQPNHKSQPLNCYQVRVGGNVVQKKPCSRWHEQIKRFVVHDVIYMKYFALWTFLQNNFKCKLSSKT